MSVAVRTKRPNPTTPVSLPKATAVPERSHPEAEAPEQGAIEREAPESTRGRWAEAGDCGEGRASYLEHEFTHGRSQS